MQRREDPDRPDQEAASTVLRGARGDTDPPGRPHHVPDPSPDPDTVDRHALRRAQGGDDRAFAELIRGHDPDLTALVTFLVGGDRVDEVLRIAYVKAYRGLSRQRDDRPPRLWLHQVVMASVSDELRRRSRRTGGRSARAGPGAETTTPGPTTPGPTTPSPTTPGADPGHARPSEVHRSPHAPSGIRILDGEPHDTAPAVSGPRVAATALPGDAPAAGAPPGGARSADPDRPALLEALDDLRSEQRFAVAIVDGVALTPEEAAVVLDGSLAAVQDRLRKGRRALRRSLELPPPDSEGGSDLAERFDAVEIAPHHETFWQEVGHHLLAARAAPAPAPAPTPDLAARRVEATVPTAMPPPRRTDGVDPRAVRDLAGQARRRRRREQGALRRLLVGTGVVIVLAALVAGGFLLASHASRSDSQLGMTSAKVIADIDDALSSDAAVSGTAVVTGSRPVLASGSYSFTRAADGSYVIRSSSPAWQEAYDASRGSFALYGVRQGSPPLAVRQSGLPAGAPDLPSAIGSGLGDPLAAAVRLVQEGTHQTLTTLTNNGNPQWVIDADLPSGTTTGRGLAPGIGAFEDPSGADHVRVTFDESLRLPVQIQFSAQTELVSQITFSDLAIAGQRPASAFSVTFPQGVEVESRDLGFETVPITSTSRLVGYPRVTPSYLPEGFTLATITARDDPPPGTATTAGDTNPPAHGIVSLAYRHGAALMVVTTRSSDTPNGYRWTDPFSTSTLAPASDGVSIDDGYFFGVEAFQGDQPIEHLWGRGDKLVFTVAGDTSGAELVKVAESLH